MRITCERDKLLAAYASASSVVPSRSPKPILQNVKLEVRDGGAILMATDLEIGIRIELAGVEVDSPGSVVLPTARFGPILRESGDSKLRLESDDRGTLIRGDRSEFRLPGENPEEFPVVAAFQESKYHEVPARLFRELIRRTVFATDAESTRFALGGVLLEFGADRIAAVATDGRRLANMEGPAHAIGGHELQDQATIVPSKAMQLIERTLGDATSEVCIAAKANGVLIKNERTTIYSSLVQGKYPKWRDVFPRRDGVRKVEMPVGLLHSAVRQAAILTSEESRGVNFRFADGTLTLTSRTANLGQSRVELPIAFESEPIVISLDPRYVADFLKVLDPEKTFAMELRDSESAAVCRTDDGYGYVIMPLALDSGA